MIYKKQKTWGGGITCESSGHAGEESQSLVGVPGRAHTVLQHDLHTGRQG